MKHKGYKEYFFILLITIIISAITVAFSAVNYCFTQKNNGVSESSANPREIKNTVVIILDAGHGGEDGGASSKDGTLEKDINLEITKLLYDYLKLCDFEVVMTRSDDRLLYGPNESNRKKFHDVRNRAAFTKEYPNSIFVSIHQNKFPVEKYKGLQVYYSKNHPDSQVLADMIQNNVVSNLQQDNKRKSKQATSSIYVLNNANVPAVLVECGFLSNPEDTENLKNKEYQKRLAFTMFTSIAEFANTYNGQENIN